MKTNLVAYLDDIGVEATTTNIGLQLALVQATLTTHVIVAIVMSTNLLSWLEMVRLVKPLLRPALLLFLVVLIQLIVVVGRLISTSGHGH